MPRNAYPQRQRQPTPPDDNDSAGEDEDGAPIAQSDDITRPPGLENQGKVPFGVLCSLYERFESATRNKHKKPGYKGELLKDFIKHWRDEVGPDLYPLIRLLLPERDTRRRTYSLKEQKLAKVLISALDLPTKPRMSDGAMRLLNWKFPTKDDPGAGEFATVAYEVINSRSSVISRYGSVDVEGVNDILDELSRTGSKATEEDGKKRMPLTEHARILKRCVSLMTPIEMKWLIRIILRDLKIGMGEKTIFNQVHPDAMELFNTCSDIKRVCWTLYDPDKRFEHEDWTIKPNRVFRPMLCGRLKGSLQDITRMMKRGRPNFDQSKPLEEGAFRNEEFIIEEKLDGERIQLHKTGDAWHYYSRKAKDYTYLYGATKESGSLTPFIHELFNEEIDELILDGEMLVWDPALRKYMPFGNLKTFAVVSRDHIGPNDPRPCFKVFDILYLKAKNGESQSFLRVALWRRRAFLQTLFKPKKGVIELADYARADSIAQIREYLGRILEERGEGLVVKHPNSMYNLGGRDDSWIKVKPEYMDELGETIDGLVIGGYWGEGRRGGILSSFLIGLRKQTRDGQEYVSFARVGSGLSRSDYTWIEEHTRDKLIDCSRSKPPAWFRTNGEWPDVFINPEDSFLIEVKAAEIVGGADYGAQMTLRFPRAVKIRHDLDFDDGTDFETVRTMRATSKKRAFGDELSSRKSARTAKSSKARSVSTPVGPVETVSKLFEGTTFFICSTKPISDKPVLEKKIAEHGGKIIQTIPPADVDRIVVAAEWQGTIKLKKGVKEIDVLKPAWITESIEKGRRLPLYKRLVAHPTPATEASLVYHTLEAEEDGELDEEKVEEKEVTMDSSPEPGVPPTRQYREANVFEHDPDSEGEPDTERDSEADDDGAGGADWDLDRSASLEQDKPSIIGGVGRVRLDTEPRAEEQPTMDIGDEEWKEWDPERIFKPCVAYFDTKENALANQLAASEVSSIVQDAADEELLIAKEAFAAAGGHPTDDLLNKSLTHIIVSRKVVDRYKELISRTKLPAPRRIVLHDWIQESLTEDTLLDENMYKP
ncbi:hypothetical protein JCM1841_003439 [Sporobolomyces salmonicolor]